MTTDARTERSSRDAPGETATADGGPPADSGAGDGAIDAGLELLGAPLVFAPTPSGFGLSVVLRSGDPTTLALQLRADDEAPWTSAGRPQSPASDIAQWNVGGLAPGRRYDYVVVASSDADAGSASPLYVGSAATAPPPGRPFTFALIADSHIEPRDPVPPGETVVDDGYGTMEQTLLDVAAQVGMASPDFVINLGDMVDYHLFGFNAPPPDASWARLAYLNYRRLLGDTVGRAAHFPVIGNWDGESGCNSPEEIARSMTEGLLYAPGPGPDTYPEGGSANGDYYAFTWGDALFVTLNVMTYTPTCHLLSDGPGLPDDWTLGAAQLAWLRQTLANATSKWRFLFIHHTDGGAAGDSDESAYGRGGAQAAHVGEQAVIQAMMVQYGVQVFFYGHDHVFTDAVVEGVHYTLPGSAGAPWKFDSSETGYSLYWTESGYARVSVAPEQAEIDFIASDGSELDRILLP
ncbi:MAG TPA: metallophosphoesterase [Polyangia bacterium]